MSCTKQSTKKYVSRPGPPYPAQECRGRKMLGNDGKLYVSAAAANGVYRWKIAQRSGSPAARKPAPKRVKKSRSRSPAKRVKKAVKKSRSPRKVSPAKRVKKSRSRSPRRKPAKKVECKGGVCYRIRK